MRFRPTFFTPTFWKYEGSLCRGVQVHVTDRDALRPVEMGVGLVATLAGLYPDQLQWRHDPGDPHPFFDLLMGSDVVRTAIQQDAEAVSRKPRCWSEPGATPTKPTT